MIGCVARIVTSMLDRGSGSSTRRKDVADHRRLLLTDVGFRELMIRVDAIERREDRPEKFVDDLRHLLEQWIGKRLRHVVAGDVRLGVVTEKDFHQGEADRCRNNPGITREYAGSLGECTNIEKTVGSADAGTLLTHSRWM